MFRETLFRGMDSAPGLPCPGGESTKVPARLDAIDRQILKELQDDGRITNVELARRVGISAPPCLRRVRALEQAGYIKGYRALLDEKRLGYEVTIFAMVHLSSQAEADLKAFEDFVLHALTSAPNVASVKTFLTIRRAKREPGVPISVPSK